MVTGSRGLTQSYWRIKPFLDAFHEQLGPVDVLIVGDCPRGPDDSARRWAKSKKLAIEEYVADWDGQGKAAGPLRNQRMVEEGKPTHCMAFWDGKSPGTLSAIKQAVAHGVHVNIVSAVALYEHMLT